MGRDVETKKQKAYVRRLKRNLYLYRKDRMRRGLLFALAKRKNQLNAACHIGKLPKEILLHILSLAHRQEMAVPHVQISAAAYKKMIFENIDIRQLEAEVHAARLGLSYENPYPSIDSILSAANKKS